MRKWDVGMSIRRGITDNYPDTVLRQVWKVCWTVLIIKTVMFVVKCLY